MKKHIRLMLCAAATALLLLLTGCFAKAPEGLYTLPKLSDEYLQLQSELDKIQGEGAEYSAPTAGSYRQAVQLEDIDGDGIKEAVAFFKVEADEKPLKIYVFRNRGGKYVRSALIEGEGMNIESVAYVDLTGNGEKELLAGWQMSAGVKLLSVYSLCEFNVTPLTAADYTRYSIFDATEDGVADLMLLRLSSSELSGEAELYTVNGDGELTPGMARLSSGVESIAQTRTGSLRNGGRALFVECVINGASTVTDIFAYSEGALKNITIDERSGISDMTLRTYTGVNCRDIDNDGVIEVPCPVQLPTRSSTATYWAVEWYAYGRSGERMLDLTTFHNISDGWYIVLPEDWHGRVTVRREDTVSGERAIVFSEIGAGVAVVDVLELYTLTGEGREARAAKEGRFVLRSTDDVIYAAEVLTQTGSRLSVSEEYVRDSFDIIYSDWIKE